MNIQILVVDDDLDILWGLRDRLKLLGYKALTAETGEEALTMLGQHRPDLILLDLSLPNMSGLDVLREMSNLEGKEAKSLIESKEITHRSCSFPVIVMTAHGSIENAVEAMKLGAFEFLTKPFEMDHLSIVIEKVLEREALKQEIVTLKSEVDSPYASVIGSSPPMQEVLEVAKRAAASEATVLLLGETGTGKELIARTIHRWSTRSQKSFMVVNCTALQETLLESELFGHEKGAFTGADRVYKGRIQAAEGGTLFLDEIGDMPLPLQSRLLRVLQDKEIQRIGGLNTQKVNVRFIAATNKDLTQAVQSKAFREDLFFRLNVVSLTLPPLRTRVGDIPHLAKFFLERHGRTAKKPSMALSAEVVEQLEQYFWPGNIRELENVMARAVVLYDEGTLKASQVAPMLQIASTGTTEEFDIPSRLTDYHKAMEDYRQKLISGALERAKGNKTKAAEELGIQRTYLNKILKRKNIKES